MESEEHSRYLEFSKERNLPELFRIYEKEGFPSERDFIRLIEDGNNDYVMYLIEKGIPHTKRYIGPVEASAKYGNVELLKLLIEYKKVYIEGAVYHSKINKKYEVVMFLYPKYKNLYNEQVSFEFRSDFLKYLNMNLDGLVIKLFIDSFPQVYGVYENVDEIYDIMNIKY